jgi:WD40 repeat protein
MALYSSVNDSNLYREDIDQWDDEDGLRKQFVDGAAAKRELIKLEDSAFHDEDEIQPFGDEGADAGAGHREGREDELSVHTAASRVSVDINGRNAFDQALRVKLNRKYHMAIRSVECDKIRSWVNAVEVTANYAPVQRQYYENAYSRIPTQELRMRSVGCAAGSGFTIAMFDLEMGTILRTIEDPKRSAILCMSMSAPLQRQKLAPLLATGHFDGRFVLRDVQTGTVLLNAVSSIVHPSPVRQCLVMEGHKRPLAIAACEEKDGRAALFVYNFEMGSLACPVIHDHVEQITCLTSVSIPGMHSLFISASMDGYVHMYDMYTCERQLTLSPEANTNGPVFALDVIPGSLTGNRPSLLLAGGMDGVIRIFNLGMGHLRPQNAASGATAKTGILETSISSRKQRSKDYDIPMAGRTSAISGSYNADSIQSSSPNANHKRAQVSYASSLRGHQGKIFALAGIATITLGCVSGGEDTCIRLWNVETGQQLLCVAGQHSAEIRSIRVTLCPRPIIVSSGYDARIIVLDLATSTNGEHRRAMKALQTKQLFIGKPKGGTAAASAEAGVFGRRTLIHSDMQSGVGMLDKRTSIIGSSRRGFGKAPPLQPPLGSTPAVVVPAAAAAGAAGAVVVPAASMLPSISTGGLSSSAVASYPPHAPLKMGALLEDEEEAGDREEIPHGQQQQQQLQLHQQQHAPQLPIIPGKLAAQRERKITVVSMAKLSKYGDSAARKHLSEDSLDVDEDDDDEEEDEEEEDEDEEA